MTHPSLRAIEIASLAVISGDHQFRSTRKASQEWEKRTIGSAFLVIATVVDERVVDVSRFDRIEQIEEEFRVLESGILETSHCRRFPSFLDLIVRPPDDFSIRDFLPVLAETRHRRQNVPSHHLPDESKGESPLTVDEIGSLDTDDVHVVLSGEVEAVICVLYRLETRERKRGFRNSSPNDRPRIDLVERLKENKSILRSKQG